MVTAGLVVLGMILWNTTDVFHNIYGGLLGSYYEFRINELIRLNDEKALSLHASEIESKGIRSSPAYFYRKVSFLKNNKDDLRKEMIKRNIGVDPRATSLFLHTAFQHAEQGGYEMPIEQKKLAQRTRNSVDRNARNPITTTLP
jgi:hypothetical protein